MERPLTAARRLAAAACASLGVLASVAAVPARAGSLLVPVHRFASGPDADAGESLSTGDDTRTVLAAHPGIRVPPGAVAWIERDGALIATLELPDSLAGAERVVATPNVVVGFGGRSLDSRLADVRRSADGRARVEIALGDEAPGSKPIGFTLRAAPPAAGSVHESEVVDVPAHAVLELGFGWLEIRAPDAAVRFAVDLCERGACTEIFSEDAPRDATGFLDRSVPLDRFAGKRASFRFRASSTSPGAFYGLPLWSDPTVWARAPADPARHNVLLISLDTLAAKHVGLWGYGRDTSPFLDDWLGAGGTVLTRCYTAATTTGPSHMTLLTGLPPSVHGVHGRTYFRALSDGVPTLALVLARAGYATAAVTEDGPMGAYRGFSRGFGSYAENKSAAVSDTLGHVETTFAAGRAWLERNRDKRFFLFLHTFQVHTPFAPPPAYRALFDGDGLDAAAEERVPPSWRAVLYDREIRYTDDVLRGFLTGLERDGLLDDTIVVVLSDHGEEFGEHGQLGHGAGVHDEVLHVPLAFRGPGVPAGRRVDARVSHVDFTPTVLALAGVGDAAPGVGRSFAPLVTGEDGDAAGAVDERPIFTEAWAEYAFRVAGGRLERVPVETPILVVRYGDRKLVRYPGSPPREVLYDLGTDPEETRPRAADGPEARELRALLDAYERDTRDARALLRGGGDAPGADLDDERREKLRALGYLE